MTLQHVVKAVVKNNGSSTAYFHVVFSESGYSPFYTSPVTTLEAGATTTIQTTHTPTHAVALQTTVVIDPAPVGVAPVANFTAAPLTGTTPLSVVFSNSTAGTEPITYAWDFENSGYVNSTLKNPTYIYSGVGNHSIKLIATNAYGSNSRTRTNYVVVGSGGILPVADFSASTTTGVYPLAVLFTNLTTNGVSYVWDFKGDGSALSYATNPSYTYNAPGSYTVKLTATNAAGTDIEVKSAYINVGEVPVIYGAPTTYGGYYVGGAVPVTSGTFSFGGGVVPTPFTGGTARGTYVGNEVTTKSQLLDALSGVGSTGSRVIIFVGSTANIDMGSSYNVQIPYNVTLASTRGQVIGGSVSSGGRIYTKTGVAGWNKPIFQTAGNNVAMCGIKLEGEAYAEGYGGTESQYRVGVEVAGHSGFEIYNCELYGFAYADVYTRNCPTGSTAPMIHHNWMHGSHNLNEGYGVASQGGGCQILANAFDHNRHDVSGEANGETVTIAYNRSLANCYLPNQSLIFDAHSDGSTHANRYDVYNNTLENSPAQTNTHRAHFLNFNQSLTTGAYVHNNLILTNWGGGSNDQGFNRPVACGEGLTSIHCTDNMWLTAVYASNTGITQSY